MRNLFVKANETFSKRSSKEANHAIRSRFSRDRDRILYSKAFRRLSGKTQVFVAGYDEVLRTRLTHTLEVAQIAKTLGNALVLDIDLIEAIAFGHDLGHTPFGHVGERCLNYVMNNCDNIKGFTATLTSQNRGFKHNYQSIRLLTFLESNYSTAYDGLNLTDYTLWGILNHSSTGQKKCDYCYNTSPLICNYMMRQQPCNNNAVLDYSFYNRHLSLLSSVSWTVEGYVVALADEIAQRHHDIEDGLIANIIQKDELVRQITNCFAAHMGSKEKSLLSAIKSSNDPEIVHSAFSKLIVELLVNDVVKQSTANIDALCSKYGIGNNPDFNRNKAAITVADHQSLISYSPTFAIAETAFHTFLKEKILKSHVVQVMDGKATYIIRQLFKAYISNPQQLPDDVIVNFYKEWMPNLNRKNLLSFIPVARMRDNLELNFKQNHKTYYRQFLTRAICDYIGSMTDNMAYRQYEILYGATKVPL